MDFPNLTLGIYIYIYSSKTQLSLGADKTIDLQKAIILLATFWLQT